MFVCAILLCVYTWVVPQLGEPTGERGGTTSVLSWCGARPPLGLLFQPCTLKRPIQLDSWHGDEQEVFVYLGECGRKEVTNWDLRWHAVV